MTRVLAIDSSQRSGGAVALADDGRLIAERELRPATGYAESLFGIIDEAFTAARLGLKDVDVFAVVRGPGSFTGLRIGIMTAKSLAFARGVALLAAGSLELVASRALANTPEAATVLSLLDAGGGHVYAAAFTPGGSGALATCLEAIRVERDELGGRISSLSAPLRVAFADTEFAHATFGAWGALKHGSPVLWPSDEETGACLAAQLALEASVRSPICAQVEPSLLVPIYLGPSQAERVHGIDLGDDVHRPRTARREEPS